MAAYSLFRRATHSTGARRGVLVSRTAGRKDALSGLRRVSLHHRSARALCFVGDSGTPASPYSSFTLSDQDTPELSSDLPHAIQCEFLVIGSGIAGLTYALKVAEHGSVAVLTKESLEEGCTQYAQGGVCAVLDPLDSVESHVKDTMTAGNFLNDERAVAIVCSEARERVLELVEMGATFTRSSNGDLHLTKEGGHSARRIVHAADATGAEITRTLVQAVRNHPRITTYENHMCLDLCTASISGKPSCLGADALSIPTGRIVRFTALATMLASGGAGQLYPSTTNPAVATGDGIAAAFRAGAAVGNIEFVQFHPTALYDPTSPGRTFLISEAVRGEGGRLYNLNGDRFMHAYDSRLELAPRDVVARAIQDQMLKHGHPHVWLDISHAPGDATLAHFPSIAARCKDMGVDITRDRIPVVPAQHYLCGGVNTSLRGETSVPGLFACGEVSHTGLHGANRLASNSLLEGLVFSARAVEPAIAHAKTIVQHHAHIVDAVGQQSRPCAGAEVSWRALEWAERLRGMLQDTMWSCAGIQRSGNGLMHGLKQLDSIEVEVRALVSLHGPHRTLAELLNLTACAKLVLASAYEREESRGLHFRVDFPDENPDSLPVMVVEKCKRRAVKGANSVIAKRGQERGIKVMRSFFSFSGS